MSAAYRFRPARNDDTTRVREIVFSVLAEYGLSTDPSGTDRDLEDLQSCYQDSGGMFDVVENNNGQIVGCAGLYPIDTHTCELRKMYLVPEVRGAGLGKQILEHCLAQARDLGFRKITLETAAVLVEAVGLYRRYGFQDFEWDRLSARCDQGMVLHLQ